MTTNPMRKYWKDQPVTPEEVYQNRRKFIASLGLAAGSIAFPSFGQEAAEFDVEKTIPAHPASDALFPAKKNEKYLAEKYSPPLKLTDRRKSLTYNNYYEFGDKKGQPCRNVDAFKPFPWQVEFAGLCNKPGSIDIEDIFEKVAFEERVYRFRCVEAWAAVVPWTGFPLSDVLRFFLEDGSWLAIRPSGTEPKCKFYYEAVDQKREAAENKPDLFHKDILHILGLDKK